MPGHWKYAANRDYAKDVKGIRSNVEAAGSQEQKKSRAGGIGGMIGSIGLPLLVAATVFSGGTTMPLLAGAIAAGVGGYAGRKLGSKLAGDSVEVDTSRTFGQDIAMNARAEVEKAQAARETGDITGSLIDAASFGVKGLASSTDIGAKAKDWYRTKVFGSEAAAEMGKAGAGTADSGVAWGTTEKFGDIFKGANIKDKLLYGTGPEVEAWRTAAKTGQAVDASLLPMGTDPTKKPWYYDLFSGESGQTGSGQLGDPNYFHKGGKLGE